MKIKGLFVQMIHLYGKAAWYKLNVYQLTKFNLTRFH